MTLPELLDRFFSEEAPTAPGDLLVVAFSGGPDSTALLHGLAALRLSRGWRLLAAHYDHHLDPGSSRRAEQAREMAEGLGVAWTSGARGPDRDLQSGESLEEGARRLRYTFLEEVRRQRGGRWVVTAHHRDDQAETVLLRWSFGSGLAGLGGIQPTRRRIVRPLLQVPREHLVEAGPPVEGDDSLRIPPLWDPTNRDLSRPRNRIRHLLLPRLAAAEGLSGEELRGRLAALAAASRRARSALEARFEALLYPRPSEDGALLVGRSQVASLPREVREWAFAWLHRRAGIPYPLTTAARGELERQIDSPGRVGCDASESWRWESRGPDLALLRAPTPTPVFSYTFEIPGEQAIPELGLRIRLHRAETAPWMFRGEGRRAALALPLEAGDVVEVRNRRPGDRIHPLGAPGERRLKEVLIDRRVPRGERDRIPLLCVAGRVAWVPGVTVDERYRLGSGTYPWVAELRTLPVLESSEPRDR